MVLSMIAAERLMAFWTVALEVTDVVLMRFPVLERCRQWVKGDLPKTMPKPPFWKFVIFC
jgi:hypothetical protein